MNTKKFLIAAIVVWLVRTALNFVFYGLITHAAFEEMTQRLPGIFREVVPA